jgi:hypothetical protein
MSWRKVLLHAVVLAGFAAALLGADASPPATTTPADKTPPAAAKSENLLFAYFVGQADGLHLASSDDGLHWTALNGDKPFLAPQVGKEKLMRDPSIQRGPDGAFHCVWTCSWNDHGIGYADSRDLIHWSEEKFIPLMENDPATRNCWAPELFYDTANSQWLILWSSTVPGKFPDTDGQDKSAKDTVGYNHRVYYVTTKDFKTFSPTKLLFNPGFNCIDAAIFQDGKKYVLVFKDETNAPFTPQKNLKLAFADHAEGPYSGVTAPISPKDPRTGQGIWAEGPTPIQVGGKWLIYFDEYRNGRYGLIESSDLTTWTDLAGQFALPRGIRHGTIFHAPADIIAALKKVE